MSRVTKIEQINIAPILLQKTSIKRVAAYARVSTYNDEQLNSLEAQKDYYEKKIEENPSWVLAGIYVDEGITGTSYRHRAEFQRMIEDCKRGKVDMVLTKSVSRFARNTVDALNVIRELKEIGVGVFFERENVWTLDSKGEFLITLLTSLAQEEARSISENTSWGLRKRFADGKYSVGYKSFLGYNAGFEINEEQAVFVRLIFRMYIQGYSTYKISQLLQRWEVRSPAGKDKWHPSSVLSILENEKYKGDALLQKTFTVDFLTKKSKKNEGELPQYYVHEGHEPIVDEVVFDYTQTLISSRASSGREKYSGITPASSLLSCGVCGAWYGPKPEHSNDKYRKIVMMCRNRFKTPLYCKNTRILQSELPNIYTEIASRIFKKYPQVKIVLQNIFLNIGIAAEVILKKSYIKDIQDISIVVSSATVFPNGILKIELIDRSRMKITL